MGFGTEHLPNLTQFFESFQKIALTCPGISSRVKLLIQPIYDLVDVLLFIWNVFLSQT